MAICCLMKTNKYSSHLPYNYSCKLNILSGFGTEGSRETLCILRCLPAYISKEGDSTSLGSLCLCLARLTAKKCFLMSRQHFLCSSECPPTLVLSLATLKRAWLCLHSTLSSGISNLHLFSILQNSLS